MVDNFYFFLYQCVYALFVNIFACGNFICKYLFASVVKTSSVLFHCENRCFDFGSRRCDWFCIIFSLWCFWLFVCVMMMMLCRTCDVFHVSSTWGIHDLYKEKFRFSTSSRDSYFFFDRLECILFSTLRLLYIYLLLVKLKKNLDSLRSPCLWINLTILNIISFI